MCVCVCMYTHIYTHTHTYQWCDLFKWCFTIPPQKIITKKSISILILTLLNVFRCQHTSNYYNFFKKWYDEGKKYWNLLKILKISLISSRTTDLCANLNCAFHRITQWLRLDGISGSHPLQLPCSSKHQLPGTMSR